MFDHPKSYMINIYFYIITVYIPITVPFICSYAVLTNT